MSRRFGLEFLFGSFHEAMEQNSLNVKCTAHKVSVIRVTLSALHFL